LTHPQWISGLFPWKTTHCIITQFHHLLWQSAVVSTTGFVKSSSIEKKKLKAWN
jgi:hypothetical protein